MRLYLIRHARPQVAAGICYGSTDLAVSPQDHVSVLSALTPALPKRAPVFSSPLQRCSELAKPLADILESGEVIHDARLVEMHFGAWERRAWDDIARAEIDAWSKDLCSYRPGGGENLMDMARRIRSFLDALRQLERDNAIAVCHAGTIRMLHACNMHDSLEEAALEATQAPHAIAYGQLLVLDC